MARPSNSSVHGEITRLLEQASAGNRASFDQLVPLIYDELHAIASARLRLEPDGHTLTPTALVHEAWLTLIGQERTQWRSRSHFYAIAALAMRRILTNHATARARHKRGGGVIALDLDAAEQLGLTVGVGDGQADELIALDAALERLKEFNPEGAEIVEYHFFGGLGFREIGEVQGTSEITVRRRWAAARAWLSKELA